MTIPKLSMKDMREAVVNDIDKNGDFQNSITIPGIDNISKYMEDLETPEEKALFRKMIQRKALNDLFPTNRKAVIDEPTRNKIIAKNSLRVEPQCKICTSIFYTVYMEWATVDIKPATECSALAEICFNENISLNTFLNHNKNHLMNKQLIRKAMVRQDPDVDPVREGTALLQLLMDEIVIDDVINIKKAKMVKDLIKVVEDAKSKREKTGGSVEGDVNITQINIDQGLPRSSDSNEMARRELSPDEAEQLKRLSSMFKDKGTGAIRKRIPKPVEVKKESTEVMDAVFTDN